MKLIKSVLRRTRVLQLGGVLLAGVAPCVGAQAFWGDLAGGPTHEALSSVASQNLDTILWSTPVDLDPQYSGSGDLYIHYGSPVFTTGDTAIVPVKTGAAGGFELEAINGATGAVKWTATTDYTLPAASWTPSYGPTITPGGTLYYAGAGGTVYSRTNIDSSSPSAATQTAFYGNGAYNGNMAGFNSTVQVCTPLTSDSQGNVYFGYRVTGSAPNGMMSGIARIGADGSVEYISASTATGGLASQIPINCAPALSLDGKTLYVAMVGSNQQGYLVALNSTTLQETAKVALADPRGGFLAQVLDISSAAPMVAPDGSVYFGVFENPYYSSKGWMLHFSSNLQTEYTPGLFGWDDTASIVPASMVPTYSGTSSYLIMTKYNNYLETGGNGINQVAILDPNATQVDPRTGVTVMSVVESIASPTPDANFPGTGAVTEWCINSAVVDPFTDSVLVNNEDGDLFRWNLATNSFTQQIDLAPPTGEAYTPTIIGPNGEVYAINDARLFAIGNAPVNGTPEPGALTLLMGGAAALAIAMRRRWLRGRGK